jgi:TfoX/Sxy family transcriptional regulator of competence genes
MAARVKDMEATTGQSSGDTQFEHVVSGIHGAEVKRMFGNPAATVNGNTFAMVRNGRVVLRLSDKDREDFMSRGGGEPYEAFPGRVAKEYAMAPAGLEGNALKHWLTKAYDNAKGLPPKEPKERRSRRRVER